jgi:polyhydroxybutyrate depolymerase
MSLRARDVVRLVLGMGWAAAPAAGCGTTAASSGTARDGGGDVRPVEEPGEGGAGAEVDASPPAAVQPAPAPAPAPAPVPAPAGAVATHETLDVHGASRAYVLVAPSVAERATSLVIALHGDGGDGASFRAALGLEQISDVGVVVAYPSGRQATWDLYTPSATNADERFLVHLVAALRARFALDAPRVFATGFSSGAFMVNQMACRRSGLFRAIASLSGGAPAEPEDPSATTWDGGYTRCPGQTRGVAALVVHGKDDGVVTWASGDYTARYWSAVDGCAGARAPASGAFGVAGCEAATACPASTPVVFCSVAGLGHAPWSEAAPLTSAFFAGF